MTRIFRFILSALVVASCQCATTSMISTGWYSFYENTTTLSLLPPVAFFTTPNNQTPDRPGPFNSEASDLARRLAEKSAFHCIEENYTANPVRILSQEQRDALDKASVALFYDLIRTESLNSVHVPSTLLDFIEINCPDRYCLSLLINGVQLSKQTMESLNKNGFYSSSQRTQVISIPVESEYTIYAAVIDQQEKCIVFFNQAETDFGFYDLTEMTMKRIMRKVLLKLL